jgi:histidinol-phosphate/aromatic aminotransferase/cobyric acid decarboxylase-like protein
MRPLAQAAALVAALALAGPTAVAAAPRSPTGQFIEDDYDRARAQARSRGVPLVVDVWAPW